MAILSAPWQDAEKTARFTTGKTEDTENLKENAL
jgi:hypothetical protein